MLWEYGTQVRYPMEPFIRTADDGTVERVWLDGEYPGGWRPWHTTWSGRPDDDDERIRRNYVEVETRVNGYAYLTGEHRVVRRPWTGEFEIVPESVMTDEQRAARRAYHGEYPS